MNCAYTALGGCSLFCKPLVGTCRRSRKTFKPTSCNLSPQSDNPRLHTSGPSINRCPKNKENKYKRNARPSKKLQEWNGRPELHYFGMLGFGCGFNDRNFAAGETIVWDFPTGNTCVGDFDLDVGLTSITCMRHSSCLGIPLVGFLETDSTRLVVATD